MINGERRGPFELSELSEAGGGPDTYVWCRGMAEWEKAEDVADICRFYRQRIFDLMHPSAPQPPATRESAPADTSIPAKGWIGKWVSDSDILPEQDPPMDTPPPSLIGVALALIVFCSPLPGFVALYFAFKSRRTWEEAMRSEGEKSKNLYDPGDAERLKKQAYDYSRKAKMWCGITFFFGFIMLALLSHRFF